MAWHSLFRTRNDKTHTCWGYTFQLTDDHLTPEAMHPLKFSYDSLGDAALDRLNAISPPPRSALPRNSGKYSESPGSTASDGPEPNFAPRRDLYILLRDNAAEDEVLGTLWRSANTVPPWVDWAQIARGQDVFYRYGGPALVGLAFQSLLGGMGSARVVEVLARTGGFSTKVARHRLFETTQHVLQCTQSLSALQPGGAGFASSIRVRLLHAAVRQRILKLTSQRPDYFDSERNGVPINDLDCVGTISSFSSTLIWLALPRQGIWLREGEIADYLAMWRYIAYLMGTPTDVFESPARAKTMMESLMMHEIAPTETSKVLANNVINALEGQAPSYPSRSFLEVMSRWLNGGELSDALGLGRPGVYYWALMTGQCLFFMAICYIYRAIPYLDRRKIAALRRLFWLVIVEGKTGLGEESTFNFKYVPDFHKMTEKEDSDKTGIRHRGIERRNLKALAVGCAVLGLTAMLGFRIVQWTASRVVESLLMVR